MGCQEAGMLGYMPGCFWSSDDGGHGQRHGLRAVRLTASATTANSSRIQRVVESFLKRLRAALTAWMASE